MWKIEDNTNPGVGEFYNIEMILVDEETGKFITTTYIAEIDVTLGWYKNVCKVCSAKCEKKKDQKWYCSKEYCSASEEGSIERETRFKVKFYIHDDNGNQAEVIMNDKLIRKKIKITSLECIESFKQEGDMHGIPKELISFLEKEYVLKLEVHRRVWDKTWRLLSDDILHRQRRILNNQDAVLKNKGGVFFVYGYGGTGKTFIWRTVCAAFRCKGDIVLLVASSGIAATLIPGGKTAHSRFGIPLSVTENSTCPRIKPGSDLTELLRMAKLIIWDEAPMTHKHSFKALDRSLKDVMRVVDERNVDEPFGGKVVVFGGIFVKFYQLCLKEAEHILCMLLFVHLIYGLHAR
ncbi:hypothetical protein KSS87_012461 [Heliosperma pusillum]|nr:hypothetical protein KSS87_012461 [Heliosperma pusillum]